MESTKLSIKINSETRAVSQTLNTCCSAREVCVRNEKRLLLTRRPKKNYMEENSF